MAASLRVRGYPDRVLTHLSLASFLWGIGK